MKFLYWTIFFLYVCPSTGLSSEKENTSAEEVLDNFALIEKKVSVIKKTELQPLLSSLNKKHQKYGLVNRYERPNTIPSKKYQEQLKIELTQDIKPTIRAIDKPLVLGASGFSTATLQADNHKLHFTFDRHLKAQTIYSAEKEDLSSLDPNFKKVESEKFLIFHRSSSDFSRELKSFGEFKPEQAIEKKEAYLRGKRVPSSWIFLEAHVVDFQNKKTNIHLLPDTKPLDLIYDDPSILKYEYQMLNSSGF